MATTNYFINDFNINDLPETNPIQTVIDEFVGKRFDYQNQKAKTDNSS
jgi:hypothetical protein